MSETLNKIDSALSSLIDKATETGPKVVDWLVQESPELVNQLLIWNAVSSALSFVFGVVLVVGGPIVWWKIIAKDQIFGSKQPDGDDPMWVVLILGSVIWTVVTQVVGWSHVDTTWLKIWIAPKVYLLEYVGALVK